MIRHALILSDDGDLVARVLALAPKGAHWFTNTAIPHAQRGQDCAREKNTGCDTSVSKLDAAESSLYDLILGGLCDHAVLSLRSTFSMQILTLMATRSLAHSPSIVDLDFGR